MYFYTFPGNRKQFFHNSSFTGREVQWKHFQTRKKKIEKYAELKFHYGSQVSKYVNKHRNVANNLFYPTFIRIIYIYLDDEDTISQP